MQMNPQTNKEPTLSHDWPLTSEEVKAVQCPHEDQWTNNTESKVCVRLAMTQIPSQASSSFHQVKYNQRASHLTLKPTERKQTSQPLKEASRLSSETACYIAQQNRALKEVCRAFVLRCDTFIRVKLTVYSVSFLFLFIHHFSFFAVCTHA